MYNSSEDLVENKIWIRNKVDNDKLVLLRHVSQENIANIKKRLNTLNKINHPSIAIPRLKQYENGEYYLEENSYEISLRQYYPQLDTNSRLELVSRMCHLVESLFMLLPEEERYHGNLRLDCFSLNHDNAIMLGGLGIEPDPKSDMERLDRLIIRMIDQQEHSDSAISNFLNILRDPLPAFKRPEQLRDALRRLLVGKSTSTQTPSKTASSGMFLKQALENIESRPKQRPPSVEEDFELSSIDFQEIRNTQVDDLESLNFEDDFDLTDIPNLGSPGTQEASLDLDSMNLDEVSAISSKGSLELDDFNIDEDLDLLQVPSLDNSIQDPQDAHSAFDDLDDFDLNIPSLEESAGENWDPGLPEAPPITPESSFEADPFEHDIITEEAPISEKEDFSAGVSEEDFAQEDDVESNNQRKKWIKAALIMGSIGAVAFGWSILEKSGTTEVQEPTKEDNIEAKSDVENVETPISKEVQPTKAEEATPQNPTQEPPPVVLPQKKKSSESVLDSQPKKSETIAKSQQKEEKEEKETIPTIAPEKPKSKEKSVQKEQEPNVSTKSKNSYFTTSDASPKNSVSVQSSNNNASEIPNQRNTPELSKSEAFQLDWKTASTEALDGKLNPKAQVALMGATPQKPEEFLRANLILLMNAQQNGKAKDIEFILNKVSRSKELKSNPIFVMASAHYFLNEQKPQKALDKLVELDSLFETVPSVLREPYLLERAEIRAMAHLALLYQSPSDLQRYEKTIKSFDSLIEVATKQNLSEVLSYAQQERAQLEQWRPQQ